MAVINVEKLSEAGKYHRLDAEFYQPQYFIDFSKGRWKPIKKFLDICQYGISQAMIEEPKGYPIFRMDDIRDCFLIDDEVKYIEISDQIFEQFKLEVNDILFNRVNAEEFVGRTGVFKLKGDYVFASYLIRLRVKPNSEILPDYLNLFLNTKYGKKQIRRYSRRAVNQANVNAEELKNFKIYVLPLDIQKQISQISDEAWNKIELSKALYSQAENLLLEELGLKDFKPKYELFYTANLSQAFGVHRVDAEYFQPMYEEIEEHLTKNFETSPIKKIRYIDVTTGQYTENYISKDKGKPYIRGTDISNGTINTDSLLYISPEDQIESKKAKEGDVVVTRVGTIGLSARVPKECEGGTISDNLIRIRIFDEGKLNSYYLALYLGSSIGVSLMIKNSRGSVQQRLNQETLKEVIIPLLPSETQQKIAELVKQSHKARREAKELLEEAKRKVEEAIENEINK